MASLLLFKNNTEEFLIIEVKEFQLVRYDTARVLHFADIFSVH